MDVSVWNNLVSTLSKILCMLWQKNIKDQIKMCIKNNKNTLIRNSKKSITKKMKITNIDQRKCKIY